MVYALLGGATVIQVEHLRAALAIWNYCEASARYICGDRLGDETADAILDFLSALGQAGATRTEISHLFNRNKTAQEIGRALKVLAEVGLARSSRGEVLSKSRVLRARRSRRVTSSTPPSSRVFRIR